MSTFPSVTASADPTHEIPAGPPERLERIARALHSLEAEEQRLLRIGLPIPLARCREQQRYWRFLNALFVAAIDPRTLAETEMPWRSTTR